MITSGCAGGKPRWQHAMAAAITDAGELLGELGIPAGSVALDEARGFPLRVPRGYLRRMRRGDPADPLLRQVLPLAAEGVAAAGYSPDPLGEHARGDNGVLRKYPGRALLVTTGACAVHCRYCFRRHFPYGSQHAGAGRWRGALAAIADDASITEVILSGGDPLSLGDAQLAELLAGLAGIAHLERIRVHTRQPIVLPERVDDGLLSVLASVRLPLIFVLHCNHHREIDAEVGRAIAGLGSVSRAVLNQAVLLAGVNDDAGTLAALSERLFEHSVLPYYLHLLDPVAGAAHFEVPESRARQLMAEVAARLPGYLVPRLCREEPGANAKTVIGARPVS